MWASFPTVSFWGHMGWSYMCDSAEYTMRQQIHPLQRVFPVSPIQRNNVSLSVGLLQEMLQVSKQGCFMAILGFVHLTCQECFKLLDWPHSDVAFFFLIMFLKPISLCISVRVVYVVIDSLIVSPPLASHMLNNKRIGTACAMLQCGKEKDDVKQRI